MNNICEHCGIRNAGRGARPVVRPGKAGADMTAVLTDAAAIRDAFRLSVCAYADYSRYQEMLLGLLEDIDESHEDNDPDSWLSFAIGSGNSDNLITAGYAAVEAEEEILTCILNRAERTCKRMLCTVLSAPEKQQNKIIGRSFKLREPDIDAFVDVFFDNAYEIDFTFDADANYDVFIAAVLYELNGFFHTKALH